MAFTGFQIAVCRLIARRLVAHGDAYVAGGAALDALAAAPRVSRDIHLFHDTAQAVASSFDGDRAPPDQAGYAVATTRARPTFVEAVVTRGSESVVFRPDLHGVVGLGCAARRVVRCLLAFALMQGFRAANSDAPAPSTAPVAAQVTLKSGHVLEGRIIGEESIRGTRLLKIETDTGTVLVPAREVAARVQGPEPDANATFEVRGVQATFIAGTVERQAAGTTAWEPVSWQDAYGKDILNEPNAIVRPGDRIRTGKDGTFDFMAHKAVWVRVERDSEVEIPARRARGSLALLKGNALFDVQGRPRGETFRVATPSAVLGVRGTHFAVGVGDGAAAGESVAVTAGQVVVNEETPVSAGEEGSWSPGSRLSTRPLSAERVASLTVSTTHIPPLELTLIPGGAYPLGGSEGGIFVSPGKRDAPTSTAYWAKASNIPIRTTTRLMPFLIARHEVAAATAMRFRQARGLKTVMEIRPSEVPPETAPAYNIDWEDARRLSCWLGLSLPTEAEWEAAARGRESRIFPWGDSPGGQVENLPHWGFLNPQAGRPRELAPTKSPITFADLADDVTPEGVLGMVSGPPEWCLDWRIDSGAPKEWHERRRYQRFEALPSDPLPGDLGHVLRGALLSTRLDLKGLYGDGAFPGVRCVRRLGSSR